MSTHSRGQCGHAVVARVPGRPGIGGRTNRAARVSSARTIGHTCKHTNTRARTHTHTRRHSLRPRRSLRRLPSLSPPFVLVTACCPCHRLWSMSLPFVHPALHTLPCAVLPCCHACSSWTHARQTILCLHPPPGRLHGTAPMTDGLKLPGCAPRRRGRTCVHAQRCGRTCFPSTARSINRREKKVNVYKGSFFYLVLRHWLATQQTQSHHAGAGGPRRGCTAARCCGWGNPRHCHRCPPPTQYGPAGHGWAASRGHAVKASPSPTRTDCCVMTC